MQSEIDTVLQQTDEIAEQVRNNNWTVVGEMAAQRQLALEKLFARPIATEDAPLIAAMAEEIMVRDKAFVSYIETQKKHTLSDFQNLSDHQRANASYQRIAKL